MDEGKKSKKDKGIDFGASSETSSLKTSYCETEKEYVVEESEDDGDSVASKSSESEDEERGDFVNRIRNQIVR